MRLSEIYKTLADRFASLSRMKKKAGVLLLAMSSSATAFAATLPAWMAGAWGGTINGVVMEEHWTAPAGGVMLGMHRDVAQSGKTSFEFLRVVDDNNHLAYLAMPGGHPATAFPLKSTGDHRV